tara:strand:- start:322 stop:603 length:282 start_codon:yes stop_codon:yes gene_type:complete
MTDEQIDKIIEYLSDKFLNMSTDAQKVILYLLGIDKTEINSLDKDDYSDEFDLVYRKKLKNIDNNIDENFKTVNRFLSGKLKVELKQLIKDYE